MAAERWVLGGGVLVGWALAGVLFARGASLSQAIATERAARSSDHAQATARVEALEKESAELRAALQELQEVWEAGGGPQAATPGTSPAAPTVVVDEDRGVGVVVQPRRRLRRRLR